MKDFLEKKFNSEYIFPLIVFIVGIIFSLLFPLYQIPDELKHIHFTYQELGQEYSVYEDYCEPFDVMRIAGNYDEKVNIKDYFNFDIKADTKLKLSLPSIKIIRHLPQSFGILIGHLFNLPILVIVFLCEIFAALFYAISCYLTLKIMPFKKNIMRFIMLLPVVIQQMGSFSYDVMLFSCCFLFVAYILYLKFTKEKITLKDVVIIGILLLLIAIIKIPYVLLALFILLIPLDKLDINLYKIKINKKFLEKNKKIILLLLLFFVICGVFVMTKITIGRTLLAFLINPIGLIKTLYFTLKSHATGFAYTIVGNLGWLDTPVSFLFLCFVVLAALLFNFFNYKNKKTFKQQFSKKEIIYIIGLFVFLFIIIILSLFQWSLDFINNIKDYDTWTIKEIINYTNSNNVIIYGIQGRYFIPILPLICLPIFSEKISKKVKKYHKYIEIIYFSILIIYLFFVILYRYWM